MAKQITLRNVSEDLSRRLEKLAEARAQSINTTVLQLLERATGMDGRRERLARYTTWTAEDVAEFEAGLRPQRTVDAKLWK